MLIVENPFETSFANVLNTVPILGNILITLKEEQNNKYIGISLVKNLIFSPIKARIGQIIPYKNVPINRNKFGKKNTNGDSAQLYMVCIPLKISG